MEMDDEAIMPYTYDRTLKESEHKAFLKGIPEFKEAFPTEITDLDSNERRHKDTAVQTGVCVCAVHCVHATRDVVHAAITVSCLHVILGSVHAIFHCLVILHFLFCMYAILHCVYVTFQNVHAYLFCAHLLQNEHVLLCV